MLTTKRVLLATICGVVFGVICMLLASSDPEITPLIKWSILVSRALLGFTIGISAIRLNWWLHGTVLGLITSIPMAIPVCDRLNIAIATIVMGIIYGFLTELITTVVFKAKAAGR
ncbi:MAG: hypothetical protein SCK70_13995, partial [bacterium]|nr:hypothetical protein [bacterium]